MAAKRKKDGNRDTRRSGQETQREKGRGWQQIATPAKELAQANNTQESTISKS